MIQTEKHNSYIYIYKLLFFENMITNEKLQGYVCAVVFSEIVFINNSFFLFLLAKFYSIEEYEMYSVVT